MQEPDSKMCNLSSVIYIEGVYKVAEDFSRANEGYVKKKLNLEIQDYENIVTEQKNLKEQPTTHSRQMMTKINILLYQMFFIKLLNVIHNFL